MFQPRTPAPPAQGDVHGVGNLGGQFVEGQGGDEADHGLGNLESDCDQIGVGEGGQFGQAVEAPAEPFQYAGIAHPIEGARVDAQAQRLGSAQGAAVLTELGDSVSN